MAESTETTQGTKTLIVQNLPNNATSEQLENIFGEIGPVRRAFIVTEKGSSVCRGFGFVTYALEDDAQQAIISLNSKPFLDTPKKMIVKFQDGHKEKISTSEIKEEIEETKKERRQSRSLIKEWRLIVRNLTFQCTTKELKDHFSSYGKLLEVTIPTKLGGQSRGFGFVQFSKKEEAEAAMEQCNLSKLMNRRITVDYAISKDKYQEYLQSSKQSNEKNQKKRKREDSEDEELDEEDMEEKNEEDMEEENEEDMGEKNEDDMKEEDEDEEEIDDEEDMEEEDEEEDEENDEENDEEKEKSKKVIQDDPDIKKGAVLFVRNLFLSTTRETLLEKMKEYGIVTGVYIVKNPESGQSRGSAFVHFKDTQSIDKLLRKVYPNLGKITSPESINSESNLMLDGRSLILSKAVDRTQAKTFSHLKERGKQMDKRSLHLANEGVIKRDSPAAKELSKEDLAKRERAQKDKKKKLQNPNYHVSRVRLAIRNLPKYLSEPDLREAFRKAATDPSLPKPKIVQAKVLMDLDKQGNVTNKSKGIGFVEFSQHEHALYALRNTNNNPEIFGNNHRLIVEFALDDVQKLKKRNQFLEKSKTLKPPMDKKSFEEMKKEKKEKEQEKNKKKKKEMKKNEQNEQNEQNEEMNENPQPNKEKPKFNSKPKSNPNKEYPKLNNLTKEKSKIPMKPPQKKRKTEHSDQFDKIVSEYKEKYFSSRPNKKWFE